MHRKVLRNGSALVLNPDVLTQRTIYPSIGQSLIRNVIQWLYWKPALHRLSKLAGKDVHDAYLATLQSFMVPERLQGIHWLALVRTGLIMRICNW